MNHHVSWFSHIFFLMQFPWLLENKPISPRFFFLVFVSFSFPFILFFFFTLAYYIKDFKFSKWKQVTSRRRKPFCINLFHCHRMSKCGNSGRLVGLRTTWENTGESEKVGTSLEKDTCERDRNYCLCPSLCVVMHAVLYENAVGNIRICICLYVCASAHMSTCTGVPRQTRLYTHVPAPL